MEIGSTKYIVGSTAVWMEPKSVKSPTTPMTREWDLSKPVVWANLAAWPLVFVTLDRYLSLFAERVAITPLPFALRATWLLACLAVGTCAWCAAQLHPAEALRN